MAGGIRVDVVCQAQGRDVEEAGCQAAVEQRDLGRLDDASREVVGPGRDALQEVPGLEEVNVGRQRALRYAGRRESVAVVTVDAEDRVGE